MTNATVNEQFPDELPEYCQYRDEGCELSPLCLKCPFPHCIYDEAGGKQQNIKEIRNTEIQRLFNTGNWQIKQLARKFHISQRTVQRALTQQKNQ